MQDAFFNRIGGIVYRFVFPKSRSNQYGYCIHSTGAVSLIIKAALIAARFSGRSRKRCFRRFATMICPRAFVH